MTVALRRLSSVLLLALTLAWGGMLSAAHMAPSADEMARASSVLALEPGTGSLCAGEETAGHAHHCPFCHALPTAPELHIDPAVSRLVFAQERPRDRVQRRPDQAGWRAHGPRAPPLFHV
ncbi:hypothetical protein [Oceanicola sp. S124]|uniref:hypothetical protein n=1 Tax=Oceanicola sp. S124 TaxID=1042378 RepID=UPI000255A454|nr:hypothetical protein [Oceanicola sp. S124]